MQAVSLSPIKEPLLDIVDMLHHATLLELKLRRSEELVGKINILDYNIPNTNDDAGSESDDELKLTVSDGKAIGKEKEDKRIDVQKIQEELQGVLNKLCIHHETSLADVFTAEENELLHSYGQNLISWFEGIRRHLIDLLFPRRVLSQEKEKRKNKWREEINVVKELRDLRASAIGIKMKLDSVATLPGVIDVDNCQVASQPVAVAAEIIYHASNPGSPTETDSLVTLLEDTKTNLKEFQASRQTYTSKADSLHSQTANVFQHAPPGYPIIPVRNVEIDIELDPTVQNIIVEESKILYSHFLSSLEEEIGKKGNAGQLNLENTISDTNKVVLKLLITCLGCDELGFSEASSLSPDDP